MNRRSNTVTAGVIVVVAVILDQLTKWWAESELDGNRVIEVLPTLEFDLAYNPGFSFGTGAGFGRWIGVLDEEDLALYDEAISQLPADYAGCLQNGGPA